jgi:protoporphyrinogen oxidase
MPRKAIIIGAGPAGLTAAYELLKRTDIVPIILEKSGDIGGISKTVNYKGNRIDIGGHRFFSKSDRVMQWWLNIMPIQPIEEKQITIIYQRRSHTIEAEKPLPKTIDKEAPDKVMLVRNRLSRIYFLRKFFAYPIQLSIDTLKKLGLFRTVEIMLSYIKVRLFPRKPEKSLEDFFINRFGLKLYKLFFKDYTEKVWGVPCTKISAEWGAQRIKGISIGKALAHAIKSLKPNKTRIVDAEGVKQKQTETSLIEKFLYPKFGPGQLWEEVAREVKRMGGEIHDNQEVKDIRFKDGKVMALTTINRPTGHTTFWEGDYFFSTMPVKELVAGMGDQVPKDVRDIAAGLQYRDFITVGILLKNLPQHLPDTWIYIQERDVKVGRIQVFNNWSPYMVHDPNTIWLGMEYFCDITDDFWQLSDMDIKAFAISELEKMALAQTDDVLDTVVLRIEKTYPAYFGSYERFDEIKQFTDQITNLFLVGRNGMHKYNNSDHSMLTAMVAVDNIIDGVITKDNIWSINTEQEYHEEKKVAGNLTPPAEPAPTSSTPEYFKGFLLRNRWNRKVLWIAGIAIILQFGIFKHFYPYAGFIDGDSYVYLETATTNADINTYPTGYSKFLRIFSAFTTSDLALVAFQFFLLQCSALYFIFTFFYLYRPARFIQVLLLGFVILNPLFLYLSNYILSDSLFISLSITWFTLLLWIIHRPTPRLLILQAILIFAAFTVRYNALYYPLIGALALILSRQKIWLKLVGISSSILLIGFFILFTSNKYYELSGVKEFSPFTGWQLANNAMYAYRYVDSQRRVPAPHEFGKLDNMIRTYFDSSRDVKKHPWELLKASTVYMWTPGAPLQRYMQIQFKHDTTASTLKKWATVAPLYEAYGKWLIRTYPREYFEYYLWPNTLKYYAPPVEFLDTYNMGKDRIGSIAQIWFKWKITRVKTLFSNFKVNTLNFYPVFVGVLNVIFLVSVLFFLLLNEGRKLGPLSKILWLVGCLWIINFSFSVFASPIALRFQVFPVLIFISVALLLLEKIWNAAFSSISKT